MIKLSGFQRNFLRKRAHGLKPVVMLGKNGLTSEVTRAIDKALEDHELIKVKFIDYKEEKKALAGSFSEKLNANLISVIGNIAIIYRESSNPEKKEIFIPGTHMKK